MLASDRQKLWDEFLEKYEPEFKEYLGYGKEEIEKIGIDQFFDAIGWEKSEHLQSFKTDKMHVIPCIDCGSVFAVFEDGYGLCEECQKKYDLNDFSKFYSSVIDSAGEKAANDLISGFFAAPEYRQLFAVKPGNVPEYAWVKKSGGSWRIVPLPNLLNLLSCGGYEYQIVLHDQSLYEKDGATEFKELDIAKELAKTYPEFFA